MFIGLRICKREIRHHQVLQERNTVQLGRTPQSKSISRGMQRTLNDLSFLRGKEHESLHASSDYKEELGSG